MRPCVRAAVAAFAILLNAILAPGWGFATTPSGDGWSICLAQAGGIQEDRSAGGSSPAAPEPSHCRLCLLPGPAAAAMAEPAPSSLPPPLAARVRYNCLDPAPVAPRRGAAFDARAPPAGATSQR